MLTTLSETPQLSVFRCAVARISPEQTFRNKQLWCTQVGGSAVGKCLAPEQRAGDRSGEQVLAVDLDRGNRTQHAFLVETVGWDDHRPVAT